MFKNKLEILWIDDEIDLLKSHFIFLESRGYLIHPFSNGREGISALERKNIDLVLLDENMPGSKPKAFTHKPESSDITGNENFLL